MICGKNTATDPTPPITPSAINRTSTESGATRVTSLIYLTPAFAIVPEFVWFGITPSPISWVGIVITCAGVVHPGYFEDLGDAVFERDMAIDYFGTLWTIRAALPTTSPARMSATRWTGSPTSSAPPS